jgi:thymidylate kinase
MKQDVLIELIESLGKQNISYALLRVDDMESGDENEIDILIQPDSINQFKEVMSNSNFFCWKSRKFLKKEVYGYFDGNRLFLVDVHYALIQDGIEYLDMDGIFERLNTINGRFLVLSNEDQLLHYFYHNLLGKHHIQPKHLESIKSLIASNLDSDYLRKKIHDPTIYSIFEVFANRPESFQRKSDRITITASRIEKRLLARSFKNIIRFLYRRFIFQKIGRTPGIHFTLMGVDGAGKSSLIDSLQQKLDETKGVKFKIVYMGPWGHSRSPIHLWLKRKQITLPKEDSSILSSPGVIMRPSIVYQTISDMIKATIYYMGVYIELWHRYLTEVKPARNKGQIVLSDRYIYDLRYIYKKRIVKNYRLMRFLVCRLFPLPDKIVFLHNDPEVIFARKPQLEKSEIELFQKLYIKALNKYDPMLLKSDKGPDVLALEILREIFSMLFRQDDSANLNSLKEHKTVQDAL